MRGATKKNGSSCSIRENKRIYLDNKEILVNKYQKVSYK